MGWLCINLKKTSKSSIYPVMLAQRVSTDFFPASMKPTGFSKQLVDFLVSLKCNESIDVNQLSLWSNL